MFFSKERNSWILCFTWTDPMVLEGISKGTPVDLLWGQVVSIHNLRSKSYRILLRETNRLPTWSTTGFTAYFERTHIRPSSGLHTCVSPIQSQYPWSYSAYLSDCIWINWTKSVTSTWRGREVGFHRVGQGVVLEGLLAWLVLANNCSEVAWLRYNRESKSSRVGFSIQVSARRDMGVMAEGLTWALSWCSMDKIQGEDTIF